MTDEQIRGLPTKWRIAAQRLRSNAAKIKARGDLSIIGGPDAAEHKAYAELLGDRALTWEDAADELDAALQRLAELPAEGSGVITAAPRLTDEEDSKALWLTRRLMPREPDR